MSAASTTMASLRNSMMNSSGGGALMTRTPADRVFEAYESLGDIERERFDAMWREHHARLALPQLPLLVWQHIAELLTFRDSLTLRLVCQRLSRIVAVKTRAVIEDHIGRFELASRSFARTLASLPTQVLNTVGIQPLSQIEFDSFVACSSWPKLRSLRIFDEPVAANGGAGIASNGLVFSSSLVSLPLMTQLESLSLWQTSELGDEVFDIVGRMSRLTSLECSILWRMTATSLRKLNQMPNLRSLHLEFCMSGAVGVVSSVCDGPSFIDNLRGLTQLRSIYVNSVMFSGPEIGALSSLTNLEQIRLRDAAIHVPSSLTQLAELPRLHTLVLMFSRAPLQLKYIYGCTQLRRLALMGQFASTEVANLAKLRTLSALALRRLEPSDAVALGTVFNEWDAPTAASLIDADADAPSLYTAASSLAAPSVAPMTAWRVAQLAKPELREFSCWMQEIEDAQSMAFIEVLPKTIRRLRLSLLEGSANMEILMSLSRLKSLELLDLDQARLSDRKLARLIYSLPSLQRLSLFGCESLGPLTLAAIGAVCTRLEALSFSRILLGAVAPIVSFAPLARCQRLSSLWLHGDRHIDDRAVMSLTQLTQLNTLDISRCPNVTQPQQVVRALPWCRVFSSTVTTDGYRESKFKFFDE